ncbi:RNA-binding S4 domain-containing protein [Cellulomonas endophytica]|uniref:RNA-binding S4 domain-containing protein n=1 Tax=Cellulomonas endophytica TaxID=2494735 RepID=UPI0030B829EC
MDSPIRLGQLLKLDGVVESGGDARALLADDAVRVNGEVETRRGRQLRPGDVVEVDLPTGVRRLVVPGTGADGPGPARD